MGIKTPNTPDMEPGNTPYSENLRKIQSQITSESAKGTAISISTYEDFSRLVNQYPDFAARSEDTFRCAHALLVSSSHLSELEQQKAIQIITKVLKEPLLKDFRTPLAANPSIGLIFSDLIDRGQSQYCAEFLGVLTKTIPQIHDIRNPASSNPSIMKACAKLHSFETKPSSYDLLLFMKAAHAQGVASNHGLVEYITSLETNPQGPDILVVLASLASHHLNEFLDNDVVTSAIKNLSNISGRDGLPYKGDANDAFHHLKHVANLASRRTQNDLNVTR